MYLLFLNCSLRYTGTVWFHFYPEKGFKKCGAFLCCFSLVLSLFSPLTLEENLKISYMESHAQFLFNIFIACSALETWHPLECRFHGLSSWMPLLILRLNQTTRSDVFAGCSPQRTNINFLRNLSEAICITIKYCGYISKVLCLISNACKLPDYRDTVVDVYYLQCAYCYWLQDQTKIR